MTMFRAMWLTLGLVCILGGSATAKVFYAQDEALAVAFPEADAIDRRTFVLTDAQAKQIESLARARLESRVITVHVGKHQGKVLGFALIDVHIVRTQPEAVMVVLSPEGQVESTMILAFHEPLDYLPANRWLKQFEKRTLTPDLSVGQGIAAITGSTLSANGVTDSARRALAIYQVMLDRKTR
jgi:hypothetical protein